MSNVRASLAQLALRLAMKRATFALLLALPVGLLAPGAEGQTASLVADLNTQDSSASTLQPQFLLAANGKLFFLAVEPIGNSLGLWATDGTPSGPELLCQTTLCAPSSFAVLGGAVLFGDGNSPLWRTDGTRAGTRPVTGYVVPRPGGYLPLGGWLYFQRCAERPTCALYRTDGTASGTGPVDTVDTGYPSTGFAEQALVGGKIYFLGRSGDSDVLRVYTAGAAGSTVVATLPGRARLLTASGNRLFFVAPSAAGQPEQVWTSDDTAAGTRPASNVAWPSPTLAATRLMGVDGRIYFVADDGRNGKQIWTSDGTAAGTRRVTALDSSVRLQFGNDTIMAVAGTHLVFLVFDTTGARRLWTTGGTPESTSSLTSAKLDGNSFDVLVRAGDRVLFAARDQAGLRLWSTDGTPAGTAVFHGLCSGNCTLVTPPVPGARGVYLAARDPRQGAALYRTDGTEPGTRRLTQYGAPDFTNVPLLPFAEVGSRLFFFAFPAGNPELWVSDGTTAQRLHELKGPAPNASPTRLTPLGSRLFFTACDGRTRDLWQTEGTAATTVKVAPIPGADCNPHVFDRTGIAATRNAVLLLTPSGPTTTALLRTDGTPVGTVALPALPGSSNGAPVSFRDRVWFALTSDSGSTVWTSDGTAAGTVPVFVPPGVSDLSALTAVGDELYFLASDPGSQTQMWQSDGTQAGTRKITRLSGGEGGFEPRFTRAGATVYFLVYSTAGTTAQVWKTDGTLAGTSLALGDAAVGNAQDLQALGGTLYVFGSTAAGQRALFRSDGTAAGTTLVQTFDRIAETSVFAGRLFFAAADGVHGLELWESDGTGAGTRLVEDIAPEIPSSSPGPFAATADRLYFPADDGLHGRELWALPLAGPGSCQPGETRLCLSGGRFQMEIGWKDFQAHTGVGHAVALTADTGYFWFFDPANVEVIAKVLDARALNQAFWVFYGALSNVEYTLTVTDTQTGLTRRYTNLAGQLASVGDTAGFGPLGAYDARASAAPPPAPALVSARTDATAATGTCTASPGQLCLQGGRFAVTAAWKDFQGKTGTGVAVPLSADTGYFWFFSPTNVEVMAKVLDGTGLNGKFWFFYGALSNVEYTLTVTDTRTGAVKTYRNPSGLFGSLADTGAF